MTWKKNDACWTALPGKKGLHPGHVVHTLDLPSFSSVPLYVIRMTARDWPHFEVRDATLMTNDPKVLPVVVGVTP